MKLRRIFHPTDFSPTASAALRFALEAASRFKAELHVGHVIYGGREYWDEDDLEQLSESDLERRLREYVFSEMVRMNWNPTRPVPLKYHVIRHATPDTGILWFARVRHSDLIVVGTHGRRGVRRFLIGSVASRVLHGARTDVAVVPPGYGHSDGGQILVPIDFCDRSAPLVSAADAIARRMQVPLDILHVLDIPRRSQLFHSEEYKAFESRLTDIAEERLEELAEFIDKNRMTLIHVESGNPAATILRYADEHDVRLIMLASSGKSPDERIRHSPKQKAQRDELKWTIGPVTERVVTHAETPVFVVKRFVESTTGRVDGVDDNQYTMAEIARQV